MQRTKKEKTATIGIMPAGEVKWIRHEGKVMKYRPGDVYPLSGEVVKPRTSTGGGE